MDKLIEYLPYLIPLVILQLTLLAAGLLDIRSRSQLRWFPKWVWVLIIIFVNLIGPLIYFTLARQEE